MNRLSLPCQVPSVAVCCRLLWTSSLRRDGVGDLIACKYRTVPIFSGGGRLPCLKKYGIGEHVPPLPVWPAHESRVDLRDVNFTDQIVWVSTAEELARHRSGLLLL